MKTGKWTKTDPDLKPYFDLGAELYMAEGLILRTDRIIPPESLRDRIIQIAHKQGHLGISTTKEMLRRKYWFPVMNSRLDTVVSTCFDCQIARNTQHTEPAKMTKLQERPWEIVEIEFCGPFPRKEYAVITQQSADRIYSRKPPGITSCRKVISVFVRSLRDDVFTLVAPFRLRDLNRQASHYRYFLRVS